MNARLDECVRWVAPLHANRRMTPTLYGVQLFCLPCSCAAALILLLWSRCSAAGESELTFEKLQR